MVVFWVVAYFVQVIRCGIGVLFHIYMCVCVIFEYWRIPDETTGHSVPLHRLYLTTYVVISGLGLESNQDTKYLSVTKKLHVKSWKGVPKIYTNDTTHSNRLKNLKPRSDNTWPISLMWVYVWYEKKLQGIKQFQYSLRSFATRIIHVRFFYLRNKRDYPSHWGWVVLFWSSSADSVMEHFSIPVKSLKLFIPLKLQMRAGIERVLSQLSGCLDLLTQPWPWPRIFKVKFWNVYLRNGSEFLR